MSRTTKASVLLLFALAGASLARAALPPYDFTGQWTGALFAAGVQEDLTAALASKGAKITGSVTADGPLGTVHCTLRGKRRRVVLARVACADGTRVKLRGTLDVAANALAGTVRLSKRGHHVNGTFSLSKQP
jgi:hypothetical protein